jgi:hypothetical protein
MSHETPDDAMRAWPGRLWAFGATPELADPSLSCDRHCRLGETEKLYLNESRMARIPASSQLIL